MNSIETSPEIPVANEAEGTPSLDRIETSPSVLISPRLQFDKHGHAIPPTEAEDAADTQALLAALAAMAAIPDDLTGSDEEFWRAIDEGRPERPLFKHPYQP